MSYEDALEIVDLDKVWHAKSSSKFENYVFYSLIILIFVTLALGFLALIGIFVFSLIHTIYAYSSGRDPELLLALIISGVAVLSLSFMLIIWPLWSLAEDNREDLRSLIRFKTSFVLDFSVYNYNIIEGLTRTLRKRRMFSSWKYKTDNLNNTQLDLVQAYLTKRYQRYVSISECPLFFSIGSLFVRKVEYHAFFRCFFVILDDKRGEVLFYINGQDEWPYLREALEKGGFLISEVNETIVDMKKYVTNDDGTIERKREKDVDL